MQAQDGSKNVKVGAPIAILAEEGDDLSGADIKAVCTEAGLLALRERRMRVTKADFTAAREKVRISVIPQVCHADARHRCCIGRTKVHRRACICRTVHSFPFPYFPTACRTFFILNDYASLMISFASVVCSEYS